MTQIELGGKFVRAGFWLALLGFVMSFGMVLHYVVGAQYDTGAQFLKNVTLWYACPWTLSTAVVLGGAFGMIAIGAVYAVFGRVTAPQPAGSGEGIGLWLCTLGLIAIFLTGYVGYFVVDSVWSEFYYAPVTTGKNVWLFMQRGCMAVFALGVMLAFGGIRRSSQVLTS